MEKGDIFDRLLYLVDSHADGKIAKFARMIGSGDQTMRSIVKNRRNYPGYEVLINILHAFEWLNAEWLLLGTGEMRKRDDGEKVPIVAEPHEDYRVELQESINTLIITNAGQNETIKSQQDTIESQRAEMERLRKEINNLKKKGKFTAGDVPHARAKREG